MFYYTNERNAQIVISLLKAHGIRKIVASPGTTNICLVSSMQRDPYFEMYSAPEERSAGYMACGLSVESGEPVVITCTGATASRNYYPAMTEAYYRKIPILAITCSRRGSRIGHNFDQVTDRTQLPKDVAQLSVQVPLVLDSETEWADVIAVNKAMLELRHNGGGPVHINLETNYSTDYSVKTLPDTCAIYRITERDPFPEIPRGRVAVFVGNHNSWTARLTEAVDKFCEIYNGIVLGDHTGNYKGKYRILANLTAQQLYNRSAVLDNIDLVIHIGNVHAPVYKLNTTAVWRVNPDGELRDTFGKLRYVFEMEEEAFFTHYLSDDKHETEFYSMCKNEENECNTALETVIDQLPFSNAWVASQTLKDLPDGSVLHLGIQNSLRFWNFFNIGETVNCFCNTGGFGIDGSLSSTIGAALTHPDKIYYCVLGDLAFFYDLNSLGNRHVANNIRIILVNNGKGTEFKLSGNPGHLFGEATDTFIAAAGHYGNKSHNLVKHYAEDLGFKYFGVDDKRGYLDILPNIISSNVSDGPMIIEVFTDSADEDAALNMLRGAYATAGGRATGKAKETIKNIIGKDAVNKMKKLVGK